MKTMTCKQLGGACDQELSADTFDEIAMLVSKHAREKVQQDFAPHLLVGKSLQLLFFHFRQVLLRELKVRYSRAFMFPDHHFLKFPRIVTPNFRIIFQPAAYCKKPACGYFL